MKGKREMGEVKGGRGEGGDEGMWGEGEGGGGGGRRDGRGDIVPGRVETGPARHTRYSRGTLQMIEN